VQLLPQVQVAPDAHCSVQLPFVHDAEQVEPEAHVVGQSPLAHVTSHVAPAGQAVVQSPPEQLTVQGPEPHVLVQSPAWQESAQDPVAGHVELQSALLHEQLPLVHTQSPPSHGVGAPALPEPPLLPDDPHPGAKRNTASVRRTPKRMSLALLRPTGSVQRSPGRLTGRRGSA
jgi:hypothetical protein